MSPPAMNLSPEQLLPARLLPAHRMVVARARTAGANGLILTGSTVRSRRTPISDLDYHVIGTRLSTGDLPEELDVHAVSIGRFRELVALGDDFTHWSLRFGYVLIDDGVIHDCKRHIDEDHLWPDVARKRTQAERSVRAAIAMVASGDEDAAVEQMRTAQTLLARWSLLAQGVFPLSRAELPDQLEHEGLGSLADDLAMTIHGAPSLRILAEHVERAQQLLASDLITRK